MPPDGWRWQELALPRGRTMRFGWVMPPDCSPRAFVVVLPGLGEFCEKYFETARDLLARGLGLCVVDWCAQGLSSRPLPNRQKRHSEGFDRDVEDLFVLVQEVRRCLVSSSGDPHIPLVMLGHSMGGNIGLRFLATHPGFFVAAAFSVPMCRIRALRGLPEGFRVTLTGLFARLRGTSYVFGAGNWSSLHRPPPPLSALSSDPVRARVHNAWCLADPRLQVGGVTFGWLHEAVRSCAALEGPGVLESIAIPCLVAVADRDVLVDPAAARQGAARLSRGQLLDLPGCLHEILMERDEYRRMFFESFDALLKDALKDCTVKRLQETDSSKEKSPMAQGPYDKARLSDRIFNALELSLAQKDVPVSELLVRALELSMTRSAGGAEFVERRDYPAEVEKALKMLDSMKKVK